MSEYITTSKEEFVVDLTCDAPGFDVSDWTGEVAFGVLGQPFDPEAAIWHAATLSAGTSSDKFTATVMQTVDVDLGKGNWEVFVRLEKTGDSTAEKPIIRCTGFLRIV